MSNRSDTLAAWIRQRVMEAGARGLVVGLSGGIDSAVVVRLCQVAMPDHVLGVIMPCHSDPRDEADAGLVADHFGVPTIRVDLAPAFDRLITDLGGALADVQAPQAVPGPDDTADPRSRMPVANVKPRLRMTSVYFLANSLNYLVVGTGNRSELTSGYFTKHGDGGVDLLPIGRLLKTEVLDLARELGVPAPVIEKPPSAGLWAGQTDEGEMGFTYADLENYLTTGPSTVAPAMALRIERLVRASEHKRALPPMPDDD
ncbi:MAG TPA: NAD(+) synthase [Egibacteraceae bacterium]|nr:NAD(+) synthase [Egibacteraceae bacterium]